MNKAINWRKGNKGEISRGFELHIVCAIFLCMVDNKWIRSSEKVVSTFHVPRAAGQSRSAVSSCRMGKLSHAKRGNEAPEP